MKPRPASEAMLTLSEILERLRQRKETLTPRTFWKYWEMDLLPRGWKIEGRGNVLYFPEDTPERVEAILFLNREIGLSFESLLSLRNVLQADRFDRNELLGKEPTPLMLVAWFALELRDQGIWQKRKLTMDQLAKLSGTADQFKRWLQTLGVKY